MLNTDKSRKKGQHFIFRISNFLQHLTEIKVTKKLMQNKNIHHSLSLKIPTTRRSFADKIFSVKGTNVWNKLLADTSPCMDCDRFKKDTL